MIDQKQLEYLCKKYKIKYQFFDSTNIIYLYTGIDDWMIKYVENKNKPFCLMHKNKLRQTKKFHVQRYLTNLYQSIHCIASHKNILTSLFASKIHKQNNNINKKGVIIIGKSS